MGRHLVIVGAAAALLGAGFATAGCGEESPSQQELREARQQGAQEARLRELERQLREQQREGRRDGGASPPGQAPSSPAPSQPTGQTSCGGGVSVGPNTSCPFAHAVEDSYPGTAEAFEVYSPVTKQTYWMRCTTDAPHVCTGGNNASVYFP